MEIINRKAKHDYFILEEIECGLVLVGSEVKSIRQGSCNIGDAFCRIKNGELFIHNMYINPYEQASSFNHEPTRMRKLLLHKKELRKWEQRIKLERLTLVPLKLYFKNGYCKILIGLAEGKKNYDKRAALKERDMQRAAQKTLNNREW